MKALIVGIDQYDNSGIEDLDGCIADAEKFCKVLECNGDDSPNFTTRTLKENVTSDCLLNEINWLFEGDAETVLFYFAGHGIFDQAADFGYLVTQDGRNAAWGVNLDTILGLANSAYPRIKSTVIILDCCHSGQIGDVGLRQGGNYATIGKGVTIMTACTNRQVAMEYNGHGLFTSILINGLEGEAADVLGDVTPASLYAHVDRTLGAFEQRPLYKANVQAFTTLRKVVTNISAVDLRKLPGLFKNPDDPYKLDPGCEPLEDRGRYTEQTQHIPFDKEKHLKYRVLQKLASDGLVEPCTEPHMWDAAMKSDNCKLTKLGQHYHYLAAKGKFGRVAD